ncbi:MAG: 50S ribosomal protein L11 methyltransferase [Rhodospirillaceae bacterium]|nr:50S ribosomal protein L11 methyltransferase [Rhodospirillaceae bacterium]
MWTVTVIVPAPAAPLFQLALEPFCLAVAAEVQGPHWRVMGYAEDLPEATALETALAVAAAGAGIAPPPAQVAPLPETDWLAENRRSFPPVSIGRFYIHRSHHDRPPVDGRIAIRLDASLAFGSGTHASTQGCLLALDRLARWLWPRRILDLGTGSGILAVAAAKLWPAHIVATDIDPAAVRMTLENAAANGVKTRIEAHAGGGLRAVPPAARFDLVLANIQVRPLTSFAPALARRIRRGGYVVLSGLLRADEAEALAAYRAQHLTLAMRFPLGEWVTLVLRRA